MAVPNICIHLWRWRWSLFLYFLIYIYIYIYILFYIYIYIYLCIFIYIYIHRCCHTEGSLKTSPSVAALHAGWMDLGRVHDRDFHRNFHHFPVNDPSKWSQLLMQVNISAVVLFAVQVDRRLWIGHCSRGQVFCWCPRHQNWLDDEATERITVYQELGGYPLLGQTSSKLGLASNTAKNDLRRGPDSKPVMSPASICRRLACESLNLVDKILHWKV